MFIKFCDEKSLAILHEKKCSSFVHDFIFNELHLLHISTGHKDFYMQ